VLSLGAGCAADKPRPARHASSARVVRIADASRHFAEQGFVEMVPSILPQTTPDARHRVAVVLRIPDRARWHARFSQRQQRFVPSYPPGTAAFRIALEHGGAGWHVTDVRGTELQQHGERFHVLRRDPERAGALVGLAWDRDDEAGQRSATAAVADLACRESDPDTDVGLVRKRNACAQCHAHDKPALLAGGDGSPAFGPTDDAGFYQVLNVLRNEGELHGMRGRDPNVDREHVELRCGSGRARVARSPEGHVEVRCPDGDALPVARYHLAAALAEGDAHARAVCESRRYLHERADEAARRAFAREFAECGLP
jgi:hypothetical protein